MRFLVVTRGREAAPPEMGMPLLQAMRAWLDEHRASGKLVDVWSFAGSVGGGGIAEVESHEELDAIMAGFPYGQVSHVDVYPLADLDANLNEIEKTIARMMQAMA